MHSDLAIACKVFRIQSIVLQSTEESEIKRLFIHLGGFHIAMSQFKANGKYIEDCGLSDILIDSGILGSGSINSFLTGKHFNRCKRLHSIIVLDGEGVEFLQNFQNASNTANSNDSDDVISYRKVDNKKLLDLLDKYENFRNKILQGRHGKTPKHYLTYVEMVNNQLIFDRSIRTGDVE